MQVYLLGQTVNIQVSAPYLLFGEKVYINSCYATPTSSISSLKYTIIDNYGCVFKKRSSHLFRCVLTVIHSHSCMLDSKQDPGASRFISRTDDTLRFSLKAFQFTADPDTEVRRQKMVFFLTFSAVFDVFCVQVSIHCKLLVASDEPGPVYKSCTYKGHRLVLMGSLSSNCTALNGVLFLDRWKALTGDDALCECCESKCVTSKSRRALREGLYLGLIDQLKKA